MLARTGCDRPTSTTLLCHSERSEESFPLRTRGRLRTMPSKEEKDKRSAVKNLFWARLQMFRCAQHDGCRGSSQRSERQTQCGQESVYVYFYTESSSIFRSPQNDKLLNCSQTPRQTGICNWRQHGKVKEKMFETAATCRDKHRLQPCEPKPRPAEARNTRPAGFGTKTTQRRPKQSLRTYNVRSF